MLFRSWSNLLDMLVSGVLVVVHTHSHRLAADFIHANVDYTRLVDRSQEDFVAELLLHQARLAR